MKPRLLSMGSLLALLSATACQTRAFNSQVSATDTAGLINKDALAQNGSEHVLPIDTWTGELIVPKVKQGNKWVLDTNKRRPDGGVFIKIHNSGHPSVKPGDIIPLVWEGMNFKVNVRFSNKVTKLIGSDPSDPAFASKRQKAGPWLLDGLNNVSALESLAFHRDPYGAGDPFYVKVKAASFDVATRTLKTHSEPVQISGSHVALIKFSKVTCDAEDVGTLESVKPISHCQIEAQHYNHNTKTFDIPTVGFEAQTSTEIPQVGKTGRAIRMSALTGIEKRSINEMGWYAYGFPLPHGGFQVTSLEPRQAMRVIDHFGHTNPYINFRDRKDGLNFIKNGQWQQEYLDKYTGQGVVKNMFFGVPADLGRWTERLGEQKFLVLNLFGWWNHNQDLERDSFLRSGHFSLGTARIVKDKFEPTEERLDIEYLQVYGINMQDIASGTMTWDHYMGNLQRGWMYVRPISDVLVRIPEFNESYFKPEIGMTSPVRPIDVIQQKTEYVMAAFRAGANMDNDKGGTADGAAPITKANSCAQDSTQAMFIALDTLFNPDVKVDENIVRFRNWVDNNPDNALAQSWKRAANVYDSQRFGVPSRMSFNDYMFRVWLAADARPGWVHNRDEVVKPAPRLWKHAPETAFGELESALGSLRSVFPAAVHQRFAEIFDEHNAQFWVLQPLQIGGSIPGLGPVSPMRPPSPVK